MTERAKTAWAFAITSVAQPGVHFAQPAEAKALARRLNDYAAELMTKWPRRFGAFATVPMREPKYALTDCTISGTFALAPTNWLS